MPTDIPRLHRGPSPWLLRVSLPLLIIGGLLAADAYRERYTHYEEGEDDFVARVWHWERLRVGMTRDEASALLGPHHFTDFGAPPSSFRVRPAPRVMERWAYGVPDEDEPDPADTYYWMVYFGPAAPGVSLPTWRVMHFEMIRAPDPIIVY